MFRFLLTVFLLIKKRESLFFVKPLSPHKLKENILTLGASFVKLAQVLATRADFFEPKYLDELKELHDELPPMSYESMQKVFERAGLFGVFDSFDENAIASASIGEVHIAYKNGQKLAVKLRRDGIKEQVVADVKILGAMSALFSPLFSRYTKNSIEAVIREFSATILEEVSLATELENLKKFSSTYKNSGIRFPAPYPEHSSDDAIVMSFEEGCRFDDRETLLRWNIDFRPLIAKLVHFYTEQMLVQGYFHADPHPGNLLVSQNGELILLDFGMVKRVPKQTRIAIIELIKAAHERDYETYVAASKKLGTIAYEAPKAQVAQFTEKMFEIFADDSLSAQSMQTLAFGVLESTAKLPFKLPQEAIYILRVSAIIEGLGTTYIENFNGIKDILPILQKNIPRALNDGKSPFELLKEEIASVPIALKNIKELIKSANDGELKVELSPHQLEWLLKELNDNLKPIITGILLILGAIFAVLVDESLKSAAILLFVAGVIRIIYR